MQTSFQHTFHSRTNHHVDDLKTERRGAETHLLGAMQRKFSMRKETKTTRQLGNKELKHINLCVLCSSAKIIGTAMPVRGVLRKTMANLFDDWLLKNYTYFVEQNDDFSARNRKL